MPHPLLHLGLTGQGSYYVPANGLASSVQEQEAVPRAKDIQPSASGGNTGEASPGAQTGEQAGQTTEGTTTPGKTKEESQQPCGTDIFLMMGGMFVIVYFLMLRPQQKQEKAKRAMLAELGKGDKIVTSAGIHCEIVAVHPEEGTVTVKFGNDPGQRFKIDRTAISRVPGGEAAPEKKG